MEQNVPVALSTIGQSGEQAISFSVLPDFRPSTVKLNIKQQALFNSEMNFKDIDTNPKNIYNIQEFDEETKD